MVFSCFWLSFLFYIFPIPIGLLPFLRTSTSRIRTWVLMRWAWLFCYLPCSLRLQSRIQSRCSSRRCRWPFVRFEWSLGIFPMMVSFLVLPCRSNSTRCSGQRRSWLRKCMMMVVGILRRTTCTPRRWRDGTSVVRVAFWTSFLLGLFSIVCVCHTVQSILIVQTRVPRTSLVSM